MIFVLICFSCISIFAGLTDLNVDLSMSSFHWSSELFTGLANSNVGIFLVEQTFHRSSRFWC